jgi:thiol:disulfide interchange protein
MALSFLGVWEIPIPGFVGRGRAGELQAKEGASGAFFKGVFATILATPARAAGTGFDYLSTSRRW